MIDFCHLIHKNKKVLSLLQILPQTMTEYGFWQRSAIAACASFYGPYLVVLVVVNLLYGEQLLICEEKPLPSLRFGPTFELAASPKMPPIQKSVAPKPPTLVLLREKLNILVLVRLESEHLIRHSPH